MKNFTYVVDFRGGTYISQVRAESIEKSMLSWAKALEVKEIQYLGEKVKEEIIRTVVDEEATPLTGLVNVWFFFVSTQSGPMYINVVQTDMSK